MGIIFRLYKNAFSGVSKSNWILGVVMLINRSGSMVVPFMALYLTKELGYDIAYAGYAMMCYGAGAVAGGYLGGRLTDKIGFYPVMFRSLFLMGILFFVLGQVYSIFLFCIVTFFLSMVGESFRPGNASAIAHYSTTENRARSYSVHRLSINLGWGIGLALGGWIADIDYRLIFWVDGVTCIAASLFLLAYLPHPQKNETQAQEETKAEIKSESAYKDKTYIAFILIVIAYALCFFQMATTLTLYYKDVVHLEEKYMGVVLSINGILIALVEMVLVYLLQNKRHELTYVAWGAILTGISFLILNLFTPAIWVVVCGMIILTLGEMICMPSMNTFWVSRSQQHNRGQYAGLYTIAWSLAHILAPLVGTQVIKHSDYTTLWYVIGGISFLCFAGALWLRKSLKQTRVN